MTKFFLMTTAAVLSIAASPVVARDARPAPTAETAESTAASDSARTETRSVKYCVMDEVTGSRIAHKMCKTRADWLKEGFDPLAK